MLPKSSNSQLRKTTKLSRRSPTTSITFLSRINSKTRRKRNSSFRDLGRRHLWSALIELPLTSTNMSYMGLLLATSFKTGWEAIINRREPVWGSSRHRRSNYAPVRTKSESKRRRKKRNSTLATSNSSKSTCEKSISGSWISKMSLTKLNSQTLIPTISNPSTTPNNWVKYSAKSSERSSKMCFCCSKSQEWCYWGSRIREWMWKKNPWAIYSILSTRLSYSSFTFCASTQKMIPNSNTSHLWWHLWKMR